MNRIAIGILPFLILFPSILFAEGLEGYTLFDIYVIVAIGAGVINLIAFVLVFDGKHPARMLMFALSSPLNIALNIFFFVSSYAELVDFSESKIFIFLALGHVLLMLIVTLRSFWRR